MVLQAELNKKIDKAIRHVHEFLNGLFGHVRKLSRKLFGRMELWQKSKAQKTCFPP